MSTSACGSAGGPSSTGKVIAITLCALEAISAIEVAWVDVSDPNGQTDSTVTTAIAVCPTGTSLIGGGYRTDETGGSSTGLQQVGGQNPASGNSLQTHSFAMCAQP